MPPPRAPDTMPATTPTDVHTLYASHHDWLRAWLLRRLNNHEDAADFAQDTFARVLRRPPVLAALREPRAYLTTIARGLLVDHWRRQSLEQALREALASLPPDLVPSEQERLAAVEALQELDQMLHDLSPDVRRAFVLSQLEGWSYADIAGHMGVSERTVKRHMARAFEACLTLMIRHG